MLTQDAALSPEELVRVFFERVESSANGYAVLPYIRGLTEPLKRLLKRYDIKVISKTSTDTQPNASITQRPTIRRKTKERCLY